MSSQPNETPDTAAQGEQPAPPNVAPTLTADDQAASTPLSPIEKIQVDAVRSLIVEVIRTVHDPEIPVNIYEMGLIYNIDVTPAGVVAIKMTLTSPACPVAGTLPIEVEEKVKGVDGVSACKVDIVWDPTWTPDLMSEAAKLELGME